MYLTGAIVLVTLIIIYQDLKAQAVDAWAFILLFILNSLYFIFFNYNLYYLANILLLILFLGVNFLVLKLVVKQNFKFSHFMGIGDIVFLLSISFNMAFINLVEIIFIASLLGIGWSIIKKSNKIPFLVPLGIVYIIVFSFLSI